MPINASKFLPLVKRLNLNFLNSPLRNFIKKKYNRSISINPYKIEDNYKIIASEYTMLSEYQHLHFSLRGPPQFI